MPGSGDGEVSAEAFVVKLYLSEVYRNLI